MREEDRRPRVLICDPIAEAGLKILRRYADIETKTNLTSDELADVISRYEAIVVRSGTEVTVEVLANATNLKVIGRAGAGLDNIDITAAKEQDVAVVNSPHANTIAVAEHTMGLMLALARRLPTADASLKAGKWHKKQLLGIGLSGKTLGIIGFGRIGREVAGRAQAFGMKVLVNQHRSTPEMDIEEIEPVDLVALLQRSDFVSLHVPFRPETKNLIGREELAHMQPISYLINTARGEVVDAAALLDALNEGQIAGAALDVFESEPATNSALAQHERVIATPHIAASTSDAQDAAAVTVAEQIVEILQSLEIDNVLPLRVVAMDKIFPHESIDQKRVNRLAGRLEEEGLLVNPPVVTETEDGHYMVLDGATRTAALKQLNFPHAVVQVCNTDTGLDLHTWYHIIQRIETPTLKKLLEDLPNITLVPVEADRAKDDMFAYGALCYVQFVDGKTYLVQPAVGINRLDALNALTEAYIAAGYVDRTLENDLTKLRHEYRDMTALVVFPEYTVSQVMQVTLSGRYFPAGITRFVIPGRILRLNAKLDLLRSQKSLREKNRELNQLLEEKLQNNAIRYYREPVYLLDE